MKALNVPALATVGCVIALLCLPRKSRHRLASSAKNRMLKGMEHMMADLPEGSPPRLVISILPKLQAQNDEIIAMLRELSELLRTQHRTAVSARRTAASRTPASRSGMSE